MILYDNLKRSDRLMLGIASAGFKLVIIFGLFILFGMEWPA